MSGTSIIRINSDNRKQFMSHARHLSVMYNLLSSLGIIPSIDKMALGDNKIYVYWNEYEK